MELNKAKYLSRFMMLIYILIGFTVIKFIVNYEDTKSNNAYENNIYNDDVIYENNIELEENILN